MIDLHTHILPGIDDGARSLAEAAEMGRLAAADGCTAMVATPHQRRGAWENTDPARLEALRAQVQEKVREAVGPGFEILSGGEIHVWPDLLSAVDRLPESGVMPLAGSRCLLLEFRGSEPPEEAGNLVHELAVAGWQPILAHPEFVPWMAEDLAVLERLCSLGALAQVTAMSVTGDFGPRPMTATHRMLEEGLVHFVASDCHGPRRRPPGLSRARQLIASRWGEDFARQLVAENPAAALAGRPLPGLVSQRRTG